MSLVNAERLIKKLLIQSKSLFHDQRHINILVISAGTFPSYEIVLTSLMEILPQLQKVSFTLVDPAKIKTDIFLNKYAKSTNTKILTSVAVNNITINKFLKMKHDVHFDVIYFEHSDLRVFPILLAKCFGMFANTVSLREAIPYLTKVINKHALIIAACLSKSELYQLKHLLKHSFDVNPQSIYLNDKYLYGGAYTSGLFISINNLFQDNYLEKRVAGIRSNDNFLFLSYILSSFIIYLTLNHHVLLQLTMLILLMCFLQLFFYRPGRYNYILFLFLVTSCLQFYYTG